MPKFDRGIEELPDEILLKIFELVVIHDLPNLRLVNQRFNHLVFKRFTQNFPLTLHCCQLNDRYPPLSLLLESNRRFPCLVFGKVQWSYDSDEFKKQTEGLNLVLVAALRILNEEATRVTFTPDSYGWPPNILKYFPCIEELEVPRLEDLLKFDTFPDTIKIVRIIDEPEEAEQNSFLYQDQLYMDIKVVRILNYMRNLQSLYVKQLNINVRTYFFNELDETTESNPIKQVNEDLISIVDMAKEKAEEQGIFTEELNLLKLRTNTDIFRTESLCFNDITALWTTLERDDPHLFPKMTNLQELYILSADNLTEKCDEKCFFHHEGINCPSIKLVSIKDATDYCNFCMTYLLESCPNLETLEIGCVRDKILKIIFEDVPNLKRLTFNSDRLMRFGAFVRHSVLPSSEEDEASSNSEADGYDSWYSEEDRLNIDNLHCLERLKINGKKTMTEAVLMEWPKMHKLIELEVGPCAVTVDTIKVLTEQCPFMKKFHCWNISNKLDDILVAAATGWNYLEDFGFGGVLTPTDKIFKFSEAATKIKYLRVYKSTEWWMSRDNHMLLFACMDQLKKIDATTVKGVQEITYFIDYCNEKSATHSASFSD